LQLCRLAMRYNAPMRFLKRIILLAGALWLTAGCSPSTMPTATAPVDPLRPYFTPIPQGTPIRDSSATPSLALSTPTPLTYTVVAGDTLMQIAQKFGVSLDDLMAANPDVSATSLMIGAVLTIPTSPILTPVTGPTPVNLPFTRLDCWPTADGGKWCFAAITNITGDTLENLIAQISLVNSSGTIAASQTSMSMLDILPPGKSTALATFFPAPMPLDAMPQAQLTSAIRILPTDSRYAHLEIGNSLVNVDWSGLTATVSGQVRPAGGVIPPEIPARNLWIAATAYDETGRVVGVRRWESTEAVPAGGTQSFEFQISSLGPAIDRVELLLEARP
jgi:LysM repeat protein